MTLPRYNLISSDLLNAANSVAPKPEIQFESVASARDPNHWLLRAKHSQTEQDLLLYLCRVFLLDPNHPEAQKELYWTLHNLLKKDAFLEYIEEEDDLYRVRTGKNHTVLVPKDRVSQKDSAFNLSNSQRRSSNWFLLTLLGFVFAGFGSLFIAPIALYFAFRARQEANNEAEQIRANIFMILELFLWIASMALTGLLVLHI